MPILITLAFHSQLTSDVKNIEYISNSGRIGNDTGCLRHIGVYAALTLRMYVTHISDVF